MSNQILSQVFYFWSNKSKGRIMVNSRQAELPFKRQSREKYVIFFKLGTFFFRGILRIRVGLD